MQHCVYEKTNAGVTLEGVVVGSRHVVHGSYYYVQADSAFRTREVRVKYVGGPRLHVKSDGKGNWHDVIRDTSLPDLNGCIDIDIGMTPATNTPPIIRLQLQSGKSKDISVAYVPLIDQIKGDFLPQKVAQRYTCLTFNKRYYYEALFRSSSADIEVDSDGFVVDYPDTFGRTTAVDTLDN